MGFCDPTRPSRSAFFTPSECLWFAGRAPSFAARRVTHFCLALDGVAPQALHAQLAWARSSTDTPQHRQPLALGWPSKAVAMITAPVVRDQSQMMTGMKVPLTVSRRPEADVCAIVQTLAASFDAITFTLDCVNFKEQRIDRMNRTKLARRSATTSTTSIGTIAKQHAEASDIRRDL
jgi:hypothetical protein